MEAGVSCRQGLKTESDLRADRMAHIVRTLAFSYYVNILIIFLGFRGLTGTLVVLVNSQNFEVT